LVQPQTLHARRKPQHGSASVGPAVAGRQHASLRQSNAATSSEIFLRLVASRIEGGRAAVLRPERRAELARAGRRAGLNAFDTQLLIAFAQDRARRGFPTHQPLPAPLDRSVPTPRERMGPRRQAGAMLLSAALGLILSLAMVRWILAG